MPTSAKKGDVKEVPLDKQEKLDELENDAKVAAFFDELAKIGAVSDVQAQKALERYESLEKAKPTAKQVGRYAGIGAVAAPAIGALSDAIAGKGFDAGKKLRGHLGRAVGGALTSGAIPIARASLDRRAEKNTLKTYLHQHGVDTAHRGAPTAGKLSAPFEPVEKAAEKKKEKDAGMTGATPARPFAAGSEYTVDLVKGAFATSAYDAGLSPPTAPQASYQPGFRAPSLQSAVQHTPQSIKTSEPLMSVFRRVFDRYLEEGARVKTAKEYKLHGHTEHQGMPIAIENRKGSVRSGTDKDGKPWRTVMKHPYGYIKGSKGADGEEVDCYVGPVKDATHAHVVHQRKDDGKTYDEDKVMLGFGSKKDAVNAYLAHYNDPKFLGPVKSLTVEKLRDLLATKKQLTKISAGAPTRGGFMMASEVPAFRQPSLQSPVQHQPNSVALKMAGVPTTPAGMLASSKRVGAPRVTAPPGPSIAQVAKPVGFGKPQAGALKDRI